MCYDGAAQDCPLGHYQVRNSGGFMLVLLRRILRRIFENIAPYVLPGALNSYSALSCILSLVSFSFFFYNQRIKQGKPTAMAKCAMEVITVRVVQQVRHRVLLLNVDLLQCSAPM